MKACLLLMMLTVNLCAAQSLAAAEPGEPDATPSPAAYNAAVGWLTELNLIERSAVIGGVRYDLGPAFEPPKVEFRDVVGGTVDMLSRGMFLAVKFVNQDGALRVTELRVIEGSGPQEDY
jgi:hypothetical protein